nr:MAG TPA: hypothetical protein [Caudoviricetes sp.]
MTPTSESRTKNGPRRKRVQLRDFVIPEISA